MYTIGKDCGPNVREQKLGTSERGLLPCIKRDSPRRYENGSEDQAVVSSFNHLVYKRSR